MSDLQIDHLRLMKEYDDSTNDTCTLSYNIKPNVPLKEIKRETKKNFKSNHKNLNNICNLTDILELPETNTRTTIPPTTIPTEPFRKNTRMKKSALIIVKETGEYERIKEDYKSKKYTRREMREKYNLSEYKYKTIIEDILRNE